MGICWGSPADNPSTSDRLSAGSIRKLVSPFSIFTFHPLDWIGLDFKGNLYCIVLYCIELN